MSSSPRVERLVGNIKGRSPQFFKIMDQLTSKFGKEHTQLINNVIIREINKNQGSRKAALMDVSLYFTYTVNRITFFGSFLFLLDASDLLKSFC